MASVDFPEAGKPAIAISSLAVGGILGDRGCISDAHGQRQRTYEPNFLTISRARFLAISSMVFASSKGERERSLLSY